MTAGADFNLDLPPLSEIDIPGIDDHPPDESVLLHGPPGTGKTTTAAARVARLIDDDSNDYEIGDVVWCTYRKALAEDTLQRLAYWGVIEPEQLNDPSEGVTRFIGTVHAVASRALGGLEDPVEDWQKREFCRDLGIQYSGGPPWEQQPGELLLDTFNWLAKNLYNPADKADIARSDPPGYEELTSKWNGSIPEAWAKWEDYKDVREVINFHEQISTAVEEETPLPGKVLIIDEYHDAFPLMAQLCERWMYDAEIVIVAGDPHQVVNDFDGADPAFFERLPYPKVLLDTTYRVPEEHWQFAAPILGKSARHEAPDVERISHGTIEHHQTPTNCFDHVGSDSSTADIGGWKTPNPHDEDGPASLVLEHGNGAKDPDGPGVGPDPGSVLILARTRMQVDGITAALERAGILYASQRNMRGWNVAKKHVRVRRYLFNAFQKLYRFNYESLGPDEGEVSGHGLGQFGSRDGSAPAERLELSPGEAAALLENTKSSDHAHNRKKTDDIAEDVRNQRHGRVIDAEQLGEWVKPSFWPHYTAGPASVGRIKKTSTTARDRQALEQALRRHTGSGAVNFGNLGVSVITIHAAKGQEGDTVMVYEGVTNRIGESMRLDEDSRANEWRTWYVATTRAAEELHIVHGGFNWITPVPNQALTRGGDHTDSEQGRTAADGGEANGRKRE